jgi:GH43 family beta-xylosidase
MKHSFSNPVYSHNFADPFVLKHRGVYWAYCTGTWADGRWFGVLRSLDLSSWEEVGGALEPLAGNWPCQWAPEVSYHNGRFYLYYSLGDEATMALRVAVADHPAGPFVDSGRTLTQEPFAIDAHVFVDDDGSRHLFYATDYLDHSHIGTGTARLLLADPLTPVGMPTAVTRPSYDWHIYHPNRAEKGGVRWHTVEGPFVLKHKGSYYQMFSGGNWQNPSYGVSYAMANTVDTADEWRQVADGEQVLPLLRSLPEAGVIGPGHNSAVRGPNNRELFCVYHRWSADTSARMMAIDRLDWVGERMLLLGPSTTAQPVYRPTLTDQFADAYSSDLGPLWICVGGAWSAGGHAASQQGLGLASAECVSAATRYLAEVSLRALDDGPGMYGVALGDQVRFMLQPEQRRALAAVRQDEGWHETALALPTDFVAQAYHLLRVELNGSRVALRLDEATLRWSAALPEGRALAFTLCTSEANAAFSGFALTEGWEDWFFPEQGAPELLGWQPDAGWQLADGALTTYGAGQPIFKGPLPAAYQIIVNGRLHEQAGQAWGFYPAATQADPGPFVSVERHNGGWALCVTRAEQRVSAALPANFQPTHYQQLRATAANGTLSLSWEGRELLSVAVPIAGAYVGLHAVGAASFELVRVTELGAIPFNKIT